MPTATVSAVPLGLLIDKLPLVIVTALPTKLTLRPTVPSNTRRPICPAAPNVPVNAPPNVIRPVNATLLAVNPGGGTKKSELLTAFPADVATEIRPDVAVSGTVVEMLVEVAEVTVAKALLNLVLSFAATSKFVPEIVVAVPGVPIVGVNPEIVGAPLAFEAVTVKEVELVAVPFGVVIAIGPVVDPVDTVARICVAVAEVTVAFVPLKLTVFRFGLALNPVPLIVTLVPMAPL